MFSLENKTILVTGVTKGIGKEILRLVHEKGAKVIGQYFSDDKSAESLLSHYPNNLFLIKQDLSQASAASELWDSVSKIADKVDVVINNAGAYIISPIDDLLAWQSGWDRNYQINLRAPAEICLHAVRHFEKNQGGIIINISSRSAHRGDNPNYLAYGATKGAMVSLTKGIARGYGHLGVLAYVLTPGSVDTQMIDDYINEQDRDQLIATLPLREITPPEDVAAMVAFLCSGQCRHATGATIDITGADYVR